MSDKTAKFIPQIKKKQFTAAGGESVHVGTGESVQQTGMQTLWEDLAAAEPKNSTAEALKELRKHAPQGEFEFRIVRICQEGKAELETKTALKMKP